MSGMFHFIKKTIYRRKAKSFLCKWAKKTNAEGNSSLYIKRGFDEAELFYDLYWYVSKGAGHSHLENISRRCNKETVIKTIKYIENHDLPMLLDRLQKEADRK